MRDKKKFKECMQELGEVFEKEISKPLIRIYWEYLKPYEDEECEKAIIRLRGMSKFFPRPAHIIEAIEPLRNECGNFIPTRCSECGREDVILVPNEDVCQACYGVVPCPPELKKKIESICHKLL